MKHLDTIEYKVSLQGQEPSYTSTYYSAIVKASEGELISIDEISTYTDGSKRIIEKINEK